MWEGSSCMALLQRNLIRGQVTGGLLPHPMPGQLHLTPHSKAKNSSKIATFGNLQKRKGKTTNLLFLFFSSFFFFFFFHISFIFCSCLCCVQSYRSSCVGALMGLLKLYLVPTSSFWSWGTVSGWSQSGVLSISGKLSG